MRMTLSGFAMAGALAVLAGGFAFAAAPAEVSASADQRLTITDSALTRVVTINGRRVRIAVSTWVDLMPPTDGREPVAASVNLSTVGGRNLPDGLVAEKILLTRTDVVLPGERRTWNPTLIPYATFRFDPTTAGYAAAGGPEWAGGTPCDVIVRLRISDRVMRVNMGSLNIAEVF